ncbi:MAG: preprotein translocase subunit SecA, partial [Coriobacteriaceae bacterium]|nr:preprotein translocase subunit SecA [Coriobacteriaceae bacterium]
MAGFLSKILTLGEGRQLKGYEETVQKINSLEAGMQERDDAALAALTPVLKERFAQGEKLDALLPEAFAVVREAGIRALGMRHFDVQLIGGMALNDGQIAEMKTGEGKTLVSTLAGYLNALSGNNVHIVTVNDYLAKRDSEWMGRIYTFLGMEVGLIQNGMPPARKIPAYQADVTYGTNAEFGFDYLRDNMVVQAPQRVQRGHHFAVVDEVDSILIDEARTPLIISGAGTKAADTYNKFARVMPGLMQGLDFDMDEAKKTINATESGLLKIEGMLDLDDLYADPSGQLANHLQQALRAQFLFHRDVDYVVIDGEVKIVDEFTGRIMEGRRYSEGLHQALEAKERVLIREENQTLATITLQNYFRLYDKLAGMTGTAMTEDAEFRQIYKLPVMAIPPNRPVVRNDENDLIYRTVGAKFNAVADDIADRHHAGQPCLIGTVSIESSERLSRLLSKRGIKHEILNAKHHEREAH